MSSKNDNILLVTGASGGIGAATSILAAKNNYNAIAVHYLNNKIQAEEVAHQIALNNIKVMTVQADISNENDVEYMYKKIDSSLGKLTSLVNNAGIVCKKSRLDSMSFERLQNIFNINIIGYILCSKYAIKRMSTLYGANGGQIVNVSSAASRLGSPNEYIDYAASKGAIDSLTTGMSLELSSEGIRVNAVRPGFINTSIHSKSGDANRVEKLISKIPLGRGGEAIEVANAILWLLSNESSYCTGSFIDLAGGK